MEYGWDRLFLYLLTLGVIIKLSMLFNTTGYMASQGLKTENAMVTPMPLTSFYWMMLSEDKDNFYVGYKSLFYEFDASDVDTIAKKRSDLNKVKWPDKDYSRLH
jgi:inner membrane protein